MKIHEAGHAARQDFSEQYNKWIWKGARQNRAGYCPDFMTFDTEFSSRAWEEYGGRKRAYAITYLWSACLFGEVYEGRTIEELLEFFQIVRDRLKLGPKRRLVVYVHNLGADFPYVYPWLDWSKVFAPLERRPLVALCDEGFEFRCSWKLSNMSLTKFLENEKAPHQKQDGGRFDYHKFRTPDTPLTVFEKYYAACDVLGLYEAIRTKMADEGDDVVKIPMTSTGYVRRYCRNNCLSDKNYRAMFRDQVLEYEQYQLLWDARRGGNTHANRAHVGKVVENVRSFDISSSYPATMLYDDYPMGPFTAAGAMDGAGLDNLLDKGYLFVARVEIQHLATDDPVPYIPVSKIVQDPGITSQYAKLSAMGAIVHDNGRVLRQVGWTEMAITSVDWEIIKRRYVFSDVRVLECYKVKKAKLPLMLRKSVSDLFLEKTKLKGIDGQEYYYVKAKNRLNGIFGMCFTDPIRDEVQLAEGEWSTIRATNGREALEQYYESRNTFLHYQWGVFVAAFARKRLQEAIEICGDKLVYVDTDSVKYIEDPAITAALLDLNKKYEAMARASDVPAMAYTNAGELQILGTWDDEGNYEQFKTYGAKKYAYVKKGKFQFTVSGLGKAAYSELKTMDDFELGRKIEDSGRTISMFDDDPNPHFVWIDGKEYEIRTNMAIVETTYTLGVTEEYHNLVDVLKDEYEFRKVDGKKILTKCSRGLDPE